MQYMLDLISAFLIGTSLLLIIFTVMLRGQEASIGATQHAAAKQGTMNLAQMVRQDFNNIGAGMDDPENALLRLDTTGAGPHRFVFWGRAYRADSTRLLCYRWAPRDTILVSQGGVLTPRPAYQVERWIGITSPTDCSTGTLGGSSIGTVTRFRIDLFHGATGGDVALTNGVPEPINPDIGVRLFVQATAASPLGPSEMIEETAWTASFAPANMRQPD